jgi:hypothetical protein
MNAMVMPRRISSDSKRFKGVATVAGLLITFLGLR